MENVLARITHTPSMDINLPYPGSTLAVPKPEFIYAVQANADQIFKHGFRERYYWEQVNRTDGLALVNRLKTRFETVAEATVLYDELRSKGLVAFRNWLA